MKSFDLTFNGAVLPERDPGQVKQDLARLFSIQDSTLIEEIFSGKTIVLRHNLDRKTAADYFRRISLLGGQAALVRTPKHRAVHRNEVLILESEIHCAAQDSPAPAQEQTTNITTHPSSSTQEQSILKALAVEATQKSQQMAARLHKQKAQFDRIAAEELEKIDQLVKENNISVQSELVELRNIEESASQSASVRVMELEEQETHSRQSADHDIARLEALVEESRTNETAATERINQHLKETGRATDEEIKRLQQVLHDAQDRAEIEIAEIEPQLQEVKTSSQLEIEELELQKNKALRAMDEELKEIEQQKEATRKQLAIHATELKQREQNVHTREREETSRLQGMEENIKSKRDQGIARVKQAISQIPAQIQADMQQLQASEPEISDQQHSKAAAIK
jgi:hypothetical protein